jgi:PAS domain S-box-containing protein
MPQSSDKRRKDFGGLTPAPAETGRQELEAPGAHVLQTLASVAPVGILRADARRYCIYVNQKWCEMSGLTPEQSMRIGWLRAFHPEDRHRVFTEWEEAVRENRPYRSEYRFRRPDGEVIWIYGQAVAEYDDGQVIGYIGTTTDITEHKQLQEQLSQTQKMEAVGRLEGSPTTSTTC